MNESTGNFYKPAERRRRVCVTVNDMGVVSTTEPVPPVPLYDVAVKVCAERWSPRTVVATRISSKGKRRRTFGTELDSIIKEDDALDSVNLDIGSDV
jgi:hypothetical protein